MGFALDALARLGGLATAPLRNTDMIWAAVPLLATLVLMTVYFGRYKGEELGWNTAVGNMLVLVFVATDLLRYIYTTPQIENAGLKTAVALFVLFQGFSLTYAEFFHFLPKKAAFFIAEPVPVNTTAYVAMAIVYADIPLDLATLAAAAGMFAVLLCATWLAKRLMRGAQPTKR
jgi:hypothetical protein